MCLTFFYHVSTTGISGDCRLIDLIFLNSICNISGSVHISRCYDSVNKLRNECSRQTGIRVSAHEKRCFNSTLTFMILVSWRIMLAMLTLLLSMLPFQDYRAYCYGSMRIHLPH